MYDIGKIRRAVSGVSGTCLSLEMARADGVAELWPASLIRYQVWGANPAISEISSGDVEMARKGKSTEEIIAFLREAEVRLDKQILKEALSGKY